MSAAGGVGKFEFANADGMNWPAPWRAMPEDEVRGYAVFAHCFTCGKDIAAATRIARALARRGLAVLRFDFTGLGNSDGDFANTDFSSNIADLVAAADALRPAHGAAAADRPQPGRRRRAGSRPPHRLEVRGVVTIAAPAEPVARAAPARRIARDHRARGRGHRQPGRPHLHRSAASSCDDLREQQTPAESIQKLGRALLIMHSPEDNGGASTTRADLPAARHPKSFLSLDPADHLLSRREDAEYAAAVIAAWSERLVGEA